MAWSNVLSGHKAYVTHVRRVRWKSDPAFFAQLVAAEVPVLFSGTPADGWVSMSRPAGAACPHCFACQRAMQSWTPAYVRAKLTESSTVLQNVQVSESHHVYQCALALLRFCSVPTRLFISTDYNEAMYSSLMEERPPRLCGLARSFHMQNMSAATFLNHWAGKVMTYTAVGFLFVCAQLAVLPGSPVRLLRWQPEPPPAPRR